MSALPSNLVARKQLLLRRTIPRWARNLEAKSPDGEKLDLRTANQLIEALQNSDTRQEACAEINQRLPNAANRHFFWLVCGWKLQDEDMASDGYENLKRMGAGHLSRNHRSLMNIQWERKTIRKKYRSTDPLRERKTKRTIPLPDWSEVIHYTLFGSETVTGEVQKVLTLSLVDLLNNALKNRYSGILTRFKQRHIDQCRRRKYENDFPRRPDVQNDHGERSESIVGFGSGGAIYDRIDHWENVPDPRSGLCGLGGTGDDTELIFQQPVALVQWTDKYQHVIASEAGHTAQQTWACIAEALASQSIDLTGMTSAQTKKSLVELIANVEGIGKSEAAKRLKRLRESDTLKQYLLNEIRRGDRYLTPLPRLVKVGKRQRKKVGSELADVRDRRHTRPDPSA